jgi:hypothetical protein
MARRNRPSRRLLLPVVLATVLAGEVAGLAVAARHGSGEAGPADAAVAESGRHGAPDAGPERRASPQRRVQEASGVPHVASIGVPPPVAPERVRPAPNRGAVARPALAAEARSVSSGPGTRRARNHVWIPSLGIDRSVEPFPCDRARPPDNFVYRWGCAGRNNVYLLGHAYSVFEPLHDAYVGGRLREGMTVDYADAYGHVRRYAVAWWKITRPSGAASWAWAPQPAPSMTLQTCVGANSEYRLIVRLLATD